MDGGTPILHFSSIWGAQHTAKLVQALNRLWLSIFAVYQRRAEHEQCNSMQWRYLEHFRHPCPFLFILCSPYSWGEAEGWNYLFLIVIHRWIEPKGSLNSSTPPLRHPGSCRGAYFPPIVSQLESTICFAYKSTVRMEMTNWSLHLGTVLGKALHYDCHHHHPKQQLLCIWVWQLSKPLQHPCPPLSSTMVGLLWTVVPCCSVFIVHISYSALWKLGSHLCMGFQQSRGRGS